MPEDVNEVTIETLQEVLQKDIHNSQEFKLLFDKFYKKLKQQQKEFIKYLECAYEKSGRDKDIENILDDMIGYNASNLLESLKRLGYALQNKLGEEFKKAGYRLLEQTRAGKRDDVMYGITRIFIVNNQNVPDVLIEAFKPYYTDELFKCFIFSFLSSVIKPEQNKKEE
jgi:uncharacterized membrane-anchored protein YjiN (DUF445 family)